MKRFLALVLCICAAAPAPAASSVGSWNAAVRDNMLTQAEADIRQYFFADRIPKIRTAIEANRAQLVRISDPVAFTRATNSVLYRASHDKHLSLWYSPVVQPPGTASDAQVREQMDRMFRYADYGYAVSARLRGNIGYLRIDGFAPWSAHVHAMVDDAMGLLANTDALIVDLRGDTGGDPASADYLMSYFFKNPTEVSGFVQRKDGRIVVDRRYTSARIGGSKYLEKPLYVLASSKTISAGEQVPYDLQTHKRALIIGETTAGGANPSAGYPLNDHFSMSVPFGSARSPITHTNWEGVGVVPDVKVSSSGALLEAYVRALRSVKNATDVAVQGRADALKNPSQALKRGLPAY